MRGSDELHLWHGNTLTGQGIFGGLFQGAPSLFDMVLTNPRFAYKTGAIQVLFLQHVIYSLKNGGT